MGWVAIHVDRQPNAIRRKKRRHPGQGKAPYGGKQRNWARTSGRNRERATHPLCPRTAALLASFRCADQLHRYLHAVRETPHASFFPSLSSQSCLDVCSKSLRDVHKSPTAAPLQPGGRRLLPLPHRRRRSKSSYALRIGQRDVISPCPTPLPPSAGRG